MRGEAGAAGSAGGRDSPDAGVRRATLHQIDEKLARAQAGDTPLSTLLQVKRPGGAAGLTPPPRCKMPASG